MLVVSPAHAARSQVSRLTTKRSGPHVIELLVSRHVALLLPLNPPVMRSALEGAADLVSKYPCSHACTSDTLRLCTMRSSGVLGAYTLTHCVSAAVEAAVGAGAGVTDRADWG